MGKAVDSKNDKMSVLRLQKEGYRRELQMERMNE
jgi:hypothetical protein